jgi:phage head maturation protease
VSAVDTPAYQDTYIDARSFFEAEAEKERMAAEAAYLAKQRIALRCKLIQLQED